MILGLQSGLDRQFIKVCVPCLVHSVYECKFILQTYLSDILLLLFAQCQLDEDLLQLFVAVVDDELLKAVVLWEQMQEGKHQLASAIGN